MKALVFGSLNIDKVYSLDKLPEKGETLYCSNYELHVGGKGLNQAISLKKAGAEVYMAGKVGSDGYMLTDFLESCGVDTSLVLRDEKSTGHAVIEVDPEGQNQMILYPGNNTQITEEECDLILEKSNNPDLIIMQCETSCVNYMLAKAKEKGIKTALNPSPYRDELKKLEFDKIDYLILNESEGQSITGKNGIDDVIATLKFLTEGAVIILTLGGNGAVYSDNTQTIKADAFKVNAVDTTGAGDTFTGYIFYSLFSGNTPDIALRTASAASAIAVTKPGAAETIPDKIDVENFLKKNG